MSFGGGTDATQMTIDVNKNGVNDNGAETMKSAYVVLDITDPERPPEVLAELSPPTLNLTTSFPQVVAVATPAVPGSLTPKSSTSPNSWYLVFGSGPTDLTSASSNQTARLFAYDLSQLAKGRGSITSTNTAPALVTGGQFSKGFVDTGEANTFVGDPLVADTNVNMRAETLYFGTVGDSTGNKGSLWRMTVGEQADPANWGTRLKLLDVGRPFLAQPSVTVDSQFRTWVIAGTGRLSVNADKLSTAQQTLFGFIDPNPDPKTKLDQTTVIPSKTLFDVSKTVVLTNGQVDEKGDKSVVDATFSTFQDKVITAGGWFRNYRSDPSATPPALAERSINRSSLIDGVLFNSAFTPSTELCTSEGTSRLFGLSFATGTALPTPVLGTEACPTGSSCPNASLPDPPMKSKDFVDLGAGLASTPSIHIGEQSVPGKVTVITQKSTGAIDTTNAQTLGGISNGEISWREFRNY